MGFMTQLRLLLWKNWTLKKRKPHVLAFELFIPLVLFFILLIIRRNQPSQLVRDLSFSAKPLPSSGLMAVMQSFCDDGVRDEDGFDTYPNATLEKFLTNLNDIARKKDFIIRPGFEPKELESIPTIYRSIIEDPVSIHSVFIKAGDFQIKDLIRSNEKFSNYLKNSEYLALNDTQVTALYETGLNMRKIHDILFGIEALIPNGNVFSLYDFMKQNQLNNSKIFMAFVWIFDVYNKGELTVDIDSFSKEAVDILINKESVKAFFCFNDSHSYASPLFRPNESYLNDFNTISEKICTNLTDSHINDLTHNIRNNFNDTKVYELLSTEWDYKRAKTRINRFFEDLNKFALFEQTLKELSEIAVSLPNDASNSSVCKKDNMTTDIDFRDSAGNQTDTAFELNMEIKSNGSSQPVNQKQKSEIDQKRRKNNVEGLVRVFQKMRETICGPKVVKTIDNKKAENITKTSDEKQNSDETSDKSDKDSEEEPIDTLTNEQKMLFNMLYSNPTILYAPNKTDSAAYQIIHKANQTFQVLDNVTTFANILLNVSTEMEDYLNLEQTQSQFLTVKDIRKDILHLPKMFRFLEFGQGLQALNRSTSIGGDSDTFLKQLKLIQNAACSWLTLTKDISLNVFRGFKTEEDLVIYFQKRAYHDNVTVLASVIFELNPNSTALPAHITYKIRQNASFTPNTAMVRGRFWFPDPGWNYNYYQFGFVWLQDILERSMISLHSGKEVTDPGTYLHQFPYPCHISDQFLFIIQNVMPLCMAISWVYSVAMLVQSIVYEKEQRLKEVMKTMGLNSLVHWLAWFIIIFLQMSITSVLLTVILKYGLVLTYSNPVLIFLYIEAFVVANILFSFLVSVLYSKAKLAAACAGIIYFLTYVPCMYLAVREETAHDKIPFWAKTLASLLSTTAFGLGAKYFAYYEEVGVGVQWSNIATSPVEDDEFTLWNVMNMMVLDALLYSTLVWYIENVHPGTYGLPRPWYFPLTKSYWLGTPIGDDDLFCAFNFKSKKFNSDTKKGRASRPPSESINLNDLIYFEAEPINLVLGVSVLNLIKIYKKGSLPAVNKLSVNLYEGQITTFLGHNGAGKTTTMSILTGLFPPTSGETHIYGMDIKTDMDVIRQSMGICPQHNVLFDELTVEEHLWFYSCLKDANGGQLKEEINKMITDLSLPIKRGKTVESLSGGMKRKLSVAIAFIGDSKVVILDEPTAGVDPYTRRAIWDLILKYKKSRTILLSTHHMDEADVLSDRIAILSNGQIKCCGSPLFLKHNLGEGYHLIFVKNRYYMTQTDANEPDVPSLEVQQFVQSLAPTAKYLFETKQEIHFILPNIELKNFVRLFTALEVEANLRRINVSTFGLKNTTLEEIFLKVASNWNFNLLKSTFQQNHKRTHSWDNPTTSASAISYDSGFNVEAKDYMKMPTEKIESKKKLLFNQFSAIIFKRWCCTKRNWKGLCSQILLPAFFVCVAMSVALIAPKSQDMPPLVLSPAQYYNYTQHLGGNVVPYCERQYQTNGNQSYNISSTFHLPSGVGSTCLLRDSKKIAENYTELSDYDLVVNYLKLNSDCTSVLVPGIKPRIFLPVAPTSHSLLENPNDMYFNATEVKPNTSDIKYYPNCQCSADGTGYVCDASGYQSPQSLKLITGDVLIDITGVGSGAKEHEYYLQSTDMYRLRRYGAYTFGLERDYVPDGFAKLVSPQQSRILQRIAVRNVSKVWFNNKGYHSMPVYLNALNNAILRSNLHKSKGNPSAFGITLINHPMVDTTYISQDQILQGTDVLIAIFIIVAMSFVPASFVLFLVYERFTKAKHLQFVSGVNVIVYWTANYFWDMCSYVVPATCCILILLIFDIPTYTSKTNFPAVVSLFLMYGWSVTPVMYPVSFIFEEPSTAYICLIVINLFVGITCIVTSFLLEVFLYMSYVPYLAHIHKILKGVFLMFPNYCLGRGLMDIAFNEIQNYLYYKTGNSSKMKSPFAWDLVTRNLVAMALSGFVFFIITLLCEYNVFRMIGRKKKNQNNYRAATPIDEDCDVARERQRVSTTDNSSDTVLRMTDLSKVFKKPQKHLAVNRLCLDVSSGECFGLLGVNGAGKSTTFKMLTGDLQISSGDAIVNQFSVRSDLHKAQQNIGYCPQFDALFDELTAREHLKFYARLRGVKEETKAIDIVLKRLELTQWADKVIRTYSGGTKRKLSAAIALISAPPIVFMDEPTTGMDPYTRRFLWDLILELVHNDNISIILTSHSMEECEALCSRVAILVNGRFTCLGSIQHLKNRFGDGYHIIARCGPHMSSSYLMGWFAKHLPNAVLRENNFNIFQFEIRCSIANSAESTDSSGNSVSDSSFSLADIFAKLQTSGIEEYTVCQNNLDNLFVNLAKQQKSGEHFVISSKVKTKQNKKYNKKSALDAFATHLREEDTNQQSLSHISLSELGGTSSTASTATASQT